MYVFLKFVQEEEGEREGVMKQVLICWFTPQMLMRVIKDQNSEPKTLFRSPTQVKGGQLLNISRKLESEAIV